MVKKKFNTGHDDMHVIILMELMDMEKYDREKNEN